MDEKVINTEPEQISEHESVDQEGVYEYFLKLAGTDKEVDWRELKEVLDYAMKAELQSKNHSISTTSIQNISKTKVDGVNATPFNPRDSQNQTQNSQNNFLSNLLGLICGTFCKDTPLADLVPQPTHNSTLMASFADYHINGFSKDICRSMVVMLDTDRSGKLGFDEFKVLWNMLHKWKDVWMQFDTDQSGSLSGFELRNAFHQAGYILNNRILNVLMHRYGNRNGEITFDDFLLCAIKLKTMLDIFITKDVTQSNLASFSKEEWLEATLSS